ncbi:SOS response-associated peptidase [Oryzifoliimicrobium ureilyticus]|uniref:SOS response-associated peptidase n=1 Tax=Oryzifoliimicrobium ureilyticus TaxID=3113724 RepID=UPI00307684AC
MCGRYALTAQRREVEEFFSGINLDEFPARYNIAPTQPILVVLASEVLEKGRNVSQRQAILARWGFLPGWVKEPKEFPLLINARAETAIGKASFRAAMRHRRVLIPASGFYEWHRPAKETKAKGQAYWLRPRRGGIVAFAGLLETWSSADGSEVDTAAILTTKANQSISAIHERMPVVIKQEDFDRWLDCKTQEPRYIADLMEPVEEDFFEAIPVSDKVNKVANMGPDLQEPETVEQAASTASRLTGDKRQLSLF